KTAVGVCLLPGGIEFSHPPAEDAKPIEVPRTDPLFLEVSWPADRRHVQPVALSSNQVQAIPSTASEFTIRTRFGTTYTLRADPAGDAPHRDTGIRILCQRGEEDPGRAIARDLEAYRLDEPPEVLSEDAIWTGPPAWDEVLLIVYRSRDLAPAAR